jgi:ABC-type nitrate/sulfonate/bicarbonate transport system permease component
VRELEHNVALRQRLPEAIYGTLGVLGSLVVLELLSRTDVVPSRHFPPPSEIFSTLGRELDGASLWSDLANTLGGWALGLTLAFAIAVPLGIAVGSSRPLYHALRFPIEFLRPIPSVALVPLVVLIYGTGLESKVFLVVFAAVWPLLIQTIYGVQDADPVVTDMARSFRIRLTDRLAYVTLPAAVPYIATGVRISSSVALILAVTAELVIGADGLGRSINLAGESGAVELMYALIVVTGIVGWALNSAFAAIERRVLHWHVSARRVEVAR